MVKINEHSRNISGYNSIDLVKFIMAFAVVAIHTGPLSQCTNTYIRIIYNEFVSLAVPFFFVASGYLLAVKMNYPFVEKDIPIIKRQLNRILKLYFLWMVLYFPIELFHDLREGTSFLKIVLSFARNVLFTGTQYNTWHFWYLLSTIYSLILIILLLKKTKIDIRGLLFISILFVFIRYVTDWFLTSNIELPIFLQMLKFVMHHTIGECKIFTGMVYIPLGMILAYIKINFPTSIVMFILALLAKYSFESNLLKALLFAMMVVGFFGIVENIELHDNDIFIVLRNSSTIIYLIHMYIFTFYNAVFYKGSEYDLDRFLFTSVVSLILSLLYIRIRMIIDENGKR